MFGILFVIKLTHNVASCFKERKQKMLHDKEAMSDRKKRLVKTAAYKQEQGHPVVLSQALKVSLTNSIMCR